MNSFEHVVYPLLMIIIVCIVGLMAYYVIDPRPATIIYREQPPPHRWDRRWGYRTQPHWRQHDGVPFHDRH